MSFTPEQLRERTLHRRAVEAAIWGMPAVNFDAMYQALVRDARGVMNQIVYWSRLLDSKNQTLTPNPDAIYLMPFYDTTDGPVVLEIPPADGGPITGSIDDAWQCAIADVGPAGSDAGKGGKYLILPPDYDDVIPDDYLPMPSPTYRGFALLRSNIAGGGDADIATAVEYGKRVKFYPLFSGDETATTFIDASDVVFDATIPYDASFFEALARRVHAEPWLFRDKVMIDPLKTIGIEKGQPFSPDDTTRATLTDVLTPQSYAHLDELATRLRASLEATIARHGFDWHVVSVGAKGCVTFRPERVREFRDFLQIDARLGHLHWLMQHNGGVFLPPWGKVEQWLLSVQHDRDDVDRFAANFARFAEAVA